MISDSCHAGELGERFMSSVRRLYEAAGMNVIELKNTILYAVVLPTTYVVTTINQVLGKEPKEK